MKEKKFILILAIAMVLGLSNIILSYAGYWAFLANNTWVYWEGHTKLYGWHWIDGNHDGVAECYYFDPDGTLIVNTKVDGWQVNADGAWVQDGVIQTQQVTPGDHFPAGSGSAAGTASTAGTASQNSKQNSSYDSVEYTPALARAQYVPPVVNGTPAPYLGKVWTYDDYYVLKSDAKEGMLSYNERCPVTGCCNPRIEGGFYCGVHTCKEPGCTSCVGFSVYNAGFCYTHMKAHGIDDAAFSRIENEQKKAAQAAANAASAKSAGTSGSAGSSGSSGSARKKSGSSAKTTPGSSYSSSGSSKKSSGSGSSSSGSKSNYSSYMDPYDEGYEDVWLDDDFDWDRYQNDSHYALGVDDAMDDLGDDW